jgi:hypothetical protein
MNEISYMSLCLYDKEKGFLFGKNRQGKYDIPVEKIGKDDIDVVDVLVRLLIREYVLYESFYFQRRCKKMVKDTYGVDVLKEMMEEIRTKYENRNGWYQHEYVYMESVFKQIVYEWLKNYVHMDFDIEMENGNLNRMVIMDISHLSLQNDKNCLGTFDKNYKNIHSKYKYGMKEYEWVKWEEIEWEKNTYFVNQVIEFMNMGVM